MHVIFGRIYLHIRIAALPPTGIMSTDVYAFFEKIPDLMAVFLLDERYLVPYLFFIRIIPEVIRNLLCHGIFRGFRCPGFLSEKEPDRTHRGGDYR